MRPRDPDYAARVRTSFAKQAFMTLIGAELGDIAPGAVDIILLNTPELAQQHGYAHAGASFAIADSAAGYAAQTLMAAGDGVLTVEFKINLLAPADGDALIARGRVLRAGKRISVVRSDVFAIHGDGERHVATALGSMMVMQGMESR